MRLNKLSEGGFPYFVKTQQFMELKDKCILVTGGSSGIGKATAQLLIEKGAKVAITGRNADKLKQVAAEIGAFPIPGDVGSEKDVLHTFAQFMGHFGRLDALINNAGIGAFSTLVDTTWEDFEKVFSVNVFGAAMMGREAAKIFIAQNSGNIVNVGSTASQKGFERGTVYSASKFALRSMSQSWQAELRKHNVRVMHVNPSEVTTAFFSADGTEREEQSNKLRAIEIAHGIVSALEMDDRGFIPEFTVWATNPW